MKQYFTLPLVLIALLTCQNAPAAEVSHDKVDADTLSRIADDVVRQTVFDLPATKTDAQPTCYNLWMYQNFMLMKGMDALVEGDGSIRDSAWSQSSFSY